MTDASSNHDLASSTAPLAIRREAGQDYLVGESVYLRGLQLRDATWAMAWRGSPFPISAKTAEAQLKTRVPADAERRLWRLIACRRDDGRPVGSVVIDDSQYTEAAISLVADPALGSRGAHLQAEMLALVVPWLSGERLRPMVRLATDVDLEPVVRQAESLGMRRAVRLRQGVWRDGRLHDQIFYEYPNPIWIARLGDPGVGIEAEGKPVTAPSSPAPRRDPRVALPLPDNALIGSERLALRPMQAADAEPIADMIRAETDTTYGHSRFPYSAVVLGNWFGEIGERDPAVDFEVAVVRRETGELIGEVGLYGIDWRARTAESGWWIYRAEDRGKGYGTEASHLLLEYGFDWLGLNMIWAWVKERNPRSQAGLRKQGYRDAGRTTWTGFGPDGFASALMFDLLAEEWRVGRG